MSVTIGSWAIPTAITIGLFLAAFVCMPTPRSTGTFMPDFGAAVVSIVCLFSSAMLSLIAWLVWALA